MKQTADEKLREEMAENVMQKTAAIMAEYKRLSLIEKMLRFDSLTKKEKDYIKAVMYLQSRIYRLLQIGAVRPAVKQYLILQKVHRRVSGC